MGKNLKTWFGCVIILKYLKNLKKFKNFSKNGYQGCHISWFLHRICPICTSYQSTPKSWSNGVVKIHWNQNHVSRELWLDTLQLIAHSSLEAWFWFQWILNIPLDHDFRVLWYEVHIGHILCKNHEIWQPW